MEYLIGTDIGTSGTKTIIMDKNGNLISSDIKEYDVITPKALWAEQWPDVWVNAVKETIKNAKKKANIDAVDIKGICISGLYGGSGIPLDEHMKPIRPCLIWMDRRAGEQENWVLENIGIDEIKNITHNGTDPYYGFTKILWIKDNEPENFANTKIFLPPNAYAIYCLTGEIAIDYSSAGNIGGIFDAKNRKWSKELMEKMGIPLSMMPSKIVDSSEIVGRLTKEIAEELDLLEGTPVCAGGIDCVVATLGLGVFSPGNYVAAIGTSMCAALVHDKPIEAKGLIEMPYVKDSKTLSYSFGGSSTAGALLKWFKNNFAELESMEEKNGGENAYASLEKKAEKVSLGSDGILVLPYFMGERSPIWNTNAVGTIFGLSLTHDKSNLYKAFLEAIAYSLNDSILNTNTFLGDYILIAGGVSKSKLFRQIVADVTGYPVICPLNDVEANLGDIILAGVGTGTIKYEDAQKWQVLDEKIMPNEKNHIKYKEYFKLYKSIYESLKTNMDELASLKVK